MKVYISVDRKGIEYTSDNGYRGVLCGESTMIIYDPGGKEVVHTYFRAANTLEELREIVDTMPEFMESLNRMMSGKEGK